MSEDVLENFKDVANDLEEHYWVEYVITYVDGRTEGRPCYSKLPDKYMSKIEAEKAAKKHCKEQAHLNPNVIKFHFSRVLNREEAKEKHIHQALFEDKE